MFRRPIFKVVRGRIEEPRRFMQALTGPRQCGKTTLARQIMEDVEIPAHYATADAPMLKDSTWIEQQWEAARVTSRAEGRHKKALLLLDEIQKISTWSETVKRLWDEDSANNIPLHVVVLGSSPLLVQKGLTESLAGRFEVVPITHWSFAEMRDAFGWDVDRYIFYGGYPGAAELEGEPNRWRRYIMDSLIETTVSRDIMLMTRVDKPALLRRLFELGCMYSGQVLSYQKMLGQLVEAGNTTTLAHYLKLLEGAGLLAGIPKYAGQRVRQRGSSPKLQVLNTALMTAQSQLDMEEATSDREYWGRLTESAVGASLYNTLKTHGGELFYWSRRNHEVDFVIGRGKMLVAIEVKSGHRKTKLSGIEAMSAEFNVMRKLLVGGDGIPIEKFLLMPLDQWLG